METRSLPPADMQNYRRKNKPQSTALKKKKRMGSRLELWTSLLKSLKHVLQMVTEASQALLCLTKQRCTSTIGITVLCSPGLLQHLPRHSRAIGDGAGQYTSLPFKGVGIIISLTADMFC